MIEKTDENIKRLKKTKKHINKKLNKNIEVLESEHFYDTSIKETIKRLKQTKSYINRRLNKDIELLEGKYFYDTSINKFYDNSEEPEGSYVRFDVGKNYSLGQLASYIYYKLKKAKGKGNNNLKIFIKTEGEYINEEN